MYLNIYMYINDIFSFICYVYSISVFIKHFTHRRRSVVLMSFLYVMMPRIVGTWENRCTSLTWAADGCAGHEPKYRTPRMFKDLGGPLDWWFLTRWTVFSKRRFDFFLYGTHFFSNSPKVTVGGRVPTQSHTENENGSLCWSQWNLQLMWLMYVVHPLC